MTQKFIFALSTSDSADMFQAPLDTIRNGASHLELKSSSNASNNAMSVTCFQCSNTNTDMNTPNFVT